MKTKKDQDSGSATSELELRQNAKLPELSSKDLEQVNKMAAAVIALINAARLGAQTFRNVKLNEWLRVQPIEGEMEQDDPNDVTITFKGRANIISVRATTAAAMRVVIVTDEENVKALTAALKETNAYLADPKSKPMPVMSKWVQTPQLEGLGVGNLQTFARNLDADNPDNNITKFFFVCIGHAITPNQFAPTSNPAPVYNRLAYEGGAVAGQEYAAVDTNLSADARRAEFNKIRNKYLATPVKEGMAVAANLQLTPIFRAVPIVVSQ